MLTLEEFKKQIISYPGIYYCGKKLFTKLAILVETATYFNDEIKDNFPELYQGPMIKNVVDVDGVFTMDITCKVNMDTLISYIMKNPQVKISYEIDDFRFIKFKFKNVSKEKTFRDIIKLGE